LPHPDYQAVLLVAFGGPEGPDDVIPFLENVLRGKNVPRERMLAVAEHYQRFGGVSPINSQNRALVEALEREFQKCGIALPVYWGNRNWHPLLADTLRSMRETGIRRALAFFTSAYSSYSSCRQYLENIEQAQREVGDGAPQVDKLRAYFNHPGFIESWIERAGDALACLPAERRPTARFVFTAHSIPTAMAGKCRYEGQLREASRLVADALGVGQERWHVAYQSRSGPPSQPWLEPAIVDCLRTLKTDGARDVVIIPIGFISDHIEVLYDLDVEARQAADEMGLNLVRVKTLGTHPRFVRMIS
jgi:protoporphyrin/coproporphyrin ferrochelatase